MPGVLNDIQMLGAIFAFLLGLAFGSFLNVVVSRWPNGESVVKPASHCRNCDHVLSWWENIPLMSWLILRGRCRQCHTRISFRYPLIELAMAILWSACWRYSTKSAFTEFHLSNQAGSVVIAFLGLALFSWLLVTLATLDAEHFWLPDVLTLPGIFLGFAFYMLVHWMSVQRSNMQYDIAGISPADLPKQALYRLCEIVFAAAIILIIRLAYWLIRRKEGMGLGDAKLMAMLGAWLGLIGALETFAIAIFAATLAALIWLTVLTVRKNGQDWAKMPLPLGTFLCLAALLEIFYPNWLWNWYARAFLP